MWGGVETRATHSKSRCLILSLVLNPNSSLISFQRNLTQPQDPCGNFTRPISAYGQCISLPPAIQSYNNSNSPLGSHV